MWTHEGGTEGNEIRLYGLSTCGWCKKCKDFLSAEGVGYDFVFVDLLEGEERSQAIAEMKEHISDLAFPLVVVNGSTIIRGYDEEGIRRAIRG